jgi:general secretion pathway protein D
LGGRGGDSGTNYQNSLRPQSAQEKDAPIVPASTAAGASGGNKDTNIRISAIEENNQLMVQATPLEWDQIESAIRKLDVVPLQVQIEARILEVNMTGDLSLGVQWYLAGLIGEREGSVGFGTEYDPQFRGNRQDRHRSALGATGNPQNPNNGGFFWSFLNRDFEVAINALETSGQAKSLAAPSLLVLNNQEAQINVGTQIPVVQTYYNGLGGTGSGLGTTGSVQYLNTGVTLNVKPRVNPGGLVYLDISQEVSNAGLTTGGVNPPIDQRLIQTQVAVQNGETLMLGGLIRDNERDNKTGLPFISRVPVLRTLFGTTGNHKDRVELIVLITPRVISNVDEARQVTQDYARQFQSLVPMTPAAVAEPIPPEPAATYPIPDNARPQEDLPSDQ